MIHERVQRLKGFQQILTSLKWVQIGNLPGIRRPFEIPYQLKENRPTFYHRKLSSVFDTKWFRLLQADKTRWNPNQRFM